MGEQRRKLVLAAKLVRFDFAGPALALSRADQEGLGGGLRAKAQATRVLLTQLIQVKFKDGMDRTAGRLWAGWQELLLEEVEDAEGGAPSPARVVEVPLAQLDWLAKIAKDDAVKVRPELAQWREALVDYLDALAQEAQTAGDVPPPAA